ncbi:MAG: hypothetical protein FJ315_04580 [SAR202 cluster bacterium]|nr:hypothetical protein [SAR202 cluster bacterium]
MSLVVGTGKHGLRVGTPDVKSVGSLAFGPDGVLFVADNAAAKIFAIDLRDSGTAASKPVNVDKLDTRLAAFLGCSREDVFIRDMAVHPTSENVYLSVMRGSGATAVPVLVKLTADGKLAEVALQNVPFSQTSIEDAPAEDDARLEVRLVQGKREGEEMQMRSGGTIRIARDKLRTVTVTDMAYVDGVLLVAGASNEEFSSTLRRIPFPFGAKALTNSLEIFHVSHGKYETASPIRTFIPYAANTSILASYTCTPVVQFSIKDAKSKTHLKGKTVAELGAGNTPLDMVSFKQKGQEFLLVSNARHPLMKLACKDLDRQQALTQPKEPEGAPRQTLPQKGVGRMANLNGSYILMMQLDHAGNVDLRSYNTAAL